MKLIAIIFIGLTLFCGFAKMIFENYFIDKAITDIKVIEKYESFKLYYSYSGLGSGMGSMQPKFIVNGREFVYTKEQNSYFGKPSMKPDSVCKGTLRTTSIDSILNVVKDINDTLIYKTNTGIMSGGIHDISVKFGKINLTFRLHNATDSSAQKIVDILNSNISESKEKLWLFDFPDEKRK